MSCDLVNGRLLDECLLGRSGVKVLYFTKFNDFDSLTGVVEVDGEITDLGTDPITIYKFDMQDNVGNFEQNPASTPENGTVFLTQNVTLTLFFVKPADLASLNNLKRGRWTIWALDFQDKIRLFGRTRGMVASGGSDVSGAAPGDKKGLDLILTSFEQDYAPFMEEFTDVPFDNFANVTVIAGETLGPELHVDANAASDPNGNEADATTGWTPTGLSGTGANVFESQAGVKEVGGFAFHTDSDDTPTPSASIDKTFTVESGATYAYSFDWRHIGGAGGIWELFIILSFTGTTVDNTDTSFVHISGTVLATSTSMLFRFREHDGSNDGGIYLDNFSLRKEL